MQTSLIVVVISYFLLVFPHILLVYPLVQSLFHLMVHLKERLLRPGFGLTKMILMTATPKPELLAWFRVATPDVEGAITAGQSSTLPAAGGPTLRPHLTVPGEPQQVTDVPLRAIIPILRQNNEKQGTATGFLIRPAVDAAAEHFRVGADEGAESSHCPREVDDAFVPTLCYGVLQHILKTYKMEHFVPGGGRILVFLPGEDEIRRVLQLLEKGGPAYTGKKKRARPAPGEDPHKKQLPALRENASGLKIFIDGLYARMRQDHESVGGKVQKDIGANEVQILLSTNICETGMTILKLRHVLDFGLQKSKIRPDGARPSTSSMKLHYASLRQLRQRRGRVGRTEDGTYWQICAPSGADQDTLLRLGVNERDALMDVAVAVETLRALGSSSATAAPDPSLESSSRVNIVEEVDDTRSTSPASRSRSGSRAETSLQTPASNANGTAHFHVDWWDPFLELRVLNWRPGGNVDQIVWECWDEPLLPRNGADGNIFSGDESYAEQILLKIVENIPGTGLKDTDIGDEASKRREDARKRYLSAIRMLVDQNMVVVNSGEGAWSCIREELRQTLVRQGSIRILGGGKSCNLQCATFAEGGQDQHHASVDVLVEEKRSALVRSLPRQSALLRWATPLPFRSFACRKLVLLGMLFML